ncbi:rubredoxin [Paraburkholderia sp. CNPSo 3272]|uniref:rubredoxin n=1 Tax=Paraburkholderia sp. CNPSo 3272 TaxID=2940931 RepID=UPI002816185F|nr:rubredoxin [Paraburkholderia sp. CNPSo 3272]
MRGAQGHAAVGLRGWIYSEAEGVPEDGIAAGNAWEDVPEDWVCPLRRVGKRDFEMVRL